LKGYQDRWLEERGNFIWKLYGEKSKIFKNKDISSRDEQLYHIMSGYFSPHSEYKKI
ncbi:MAG: hypothetical protein IPH04_13650, partial [Saprospirales bacterium]|nr:hypothetical protein [Saprospirales bacterium]